MLDKIMYIIYNSKCRAHVYANKVHQNESRSKQYWGGTIGDNNQSNINNVENRIEKLSKEIRAV